METSEIIQFIHDAIPAYENPDSCSNVVPVVNAFLRSLPKEQLEEVDEALKQTDGLPYGINSYLTWLLHPNPRSLPEVNEPIEDLIRWYNDKKSRKVEYARVRLMRRFNGQSYVHQYAILKSFLAGDRKACDWAARHLLGNWIPSFEEAVAHRWETTPSKSLAMVVIYHLPAEYVILHQDSLCKYVEYKYLCARLYDTEGFALDESRLEVPDIFFIMGRLDRKDQIPHLRIRLAEYFETHQEIESNALYWMASLGMTDDLVNIYNRYTNN